MKCPSCGEEFKATPVDGRVTCPGCGKTLKVKVKAKTEEKAAPVEKKEVEPPKPKKAEPKPVEPKNDTFDNDDDWGDAWGDETPAKKSAPAVSKAPKKKPVAEDTYDEDEEDDGFDSEDDDFDPAPKKKAAPKKKETFNYDEDDDEDDFDPTPKSKANPKKEVGVENGFGGSDLLTFKDALIGMLVGVIPCVGIVILFLSVFGVMFKNKPSIRNMHKAILVIGAVFFVFTFLVSALTGSLVVNILK